MTVDPSTVAVVEAMAKAGWTAAMIAVALRAASQSEIPSETVEARGGAGVDGVVGDLNLSSSGTLTTETSPRFNETLKRLSPAHPQPSTPRVRKHRAAKAMKRQPVSTGVSPDVSLSLKESLCLVEKDGAVNCGNSVQEPFAMTAQWQPSAKSRASLNELLGETGAGILLDKFRDIQEVSRRTMTDAEWNARLRAWAKDERKPFQGVQMNLPLMRVASARAEPPSTAWRLQRAIEETLQRRESG